MRRRTTQDALKHVKRAIYDAYEAEIIFILSEFRLFKEEHRKMLVSRVIPDYSNMLETIEAARIFIRKNDESKTRGENYRRAKQHLDVVASNIKRFEAAGDELNKIADKDRKKFLFDLILLVGTIFGAIAAVVVLIISTIPILVQIFF